MPNHRTLRNEAERRRIHHSASFRSGRLVYGRWAAHHSGRACVNRIRAAEATEAHARGYERCHRRRERENAFLIALMASPASTSAVVTRVALDARAAAG